MEEKTLIELYMVFDEEEQKHYEKLFKEFHQKKLQESVKYDFSKNPFGELVGLRSITEIEQEFIKESDIMDKYNERVNPIREKMTKMDRRERFRRKVKIAEPIGGLGEGGAGNYVADFVCTGDTVLQ